MRAEGCPGDLLYLVLLTSDFRKFIYIIRNFVFQEKQTSPYLDRIVC
jgi:hypothetical protein